MLANYWSEFVTIAVVHLFAVMSPGPDFAVVSKYSFSHGRRTAMWVSVGIGSGIILHVTYSLVGLALIIHQTLWLYQLLLCAGALYLGWIGVQAIQAQPRAAYSAEQAEVRQPSRWRAFLIGFLTNGLNVKATLFFLALFTTIISPQTPLVVKMGYGAYLTVATAAWFLTLSWILTHKRWFAVLWRNSHWLDRVMGVLLILLAGRLLVELAHSLGFIASA
ncbi:lysine transporter LysE [Idiomarina tyrosinivorans]|uniref:Lysine transporter LysE n=1 Tax=Idiomarina tyrosinivorans TaxID=1445662 RepID=A0A432ZTU7_9GAMM|nr:LysE family transporter [Idiomarina tyrosinivorans]RUO81271.1 lysine transporter LysE [Idiomarina tyrosinivorans]